MAENVVINGVTYQNVPWMRAPLSSDPTSYGYYYDISDATIDSGDKILSGNTAYGSGGTKYTGTIATKTSSDLSASGATVTVPAGYYASQYTKTISSGSATVGNIHSVNLSTITAGASSITLTSTETVTPTVSAGYIANGTASNITVDLTAQCTVKAAATITPGTSDQTIAANTWIKGAQTISGDADLVAGNIKQGVTIFGVLGTLASVSIVQDNDTHGLTIS